MDELNQYRHMWRTRREEYLLIEYSHPFILGTAYMIYDITSQTGMIIENDNIGEAVIKEMLKHGVKVVDRLPESDEP